MRQVETIRLTEFEWDEEKRLRTRAEREIDFVDAADALLRPHLETSSDRKGERRTLAICELGNQIVAVIYTARDQVCRIISVRAARRYEREEYRSLFGGGD